MDFADEILAAFHPFVEQVVMIYAVVHLALRDEPIEFDLFSPADIERAMKVNVVNPLMMVKYMLDFGALNPRGLVIFPNDRRAFPFDRVPTTVSTAGRRETVEAFFRTGGAVFSQLKVDRKSVV